MVIYKFYVPLDGPFADSKRDYTIEMPKGAETLCVQVQSGLYCIWAKVEPESEKIDRKIMWRGTGSRAPDRAFYVGTVQDGESVWHLFMDIQPLDAVMD